MPTLYTKTMPFLSKELEQAQNLVFMGDVGVHFSQVQMNDYTFHILFCGYLKDRVAFTLQLSKIRRLK